MSKVLFLKIFLSMVGSLTLSSIDAQLINSTHRHQHYHYFSFGALTGASFLFAGKCNGALNVSFPYTVTTLSGATSDSVFKSKPIQPFARLKAFSVPIYVEAGNERQFFYFRFFSLATTGEDAGYNFALGYGHLFYFNVMHNHSTRITERQFVIKPSLNIECTFYRGFDGGSQFYLGTIDNLNKYIKVLGYTAGPTFTSTDRYARVYAAKTLDVVYAQTVLAVVPKLSISNNPFKHAVHWQINMGYNMDAFNKGGIILRQNFLQSIKSPSIINIADKGIVARYNGNKVTSAPYNLSGFFIGVEFGVNISS